MYVKLSEVIFEISRVLRDKKAKLTSFGWRRSCSLAFCELRRDSLPSILAKLKA
jgi:hypothetical protein